MIQQSLPRLAATLGICALCLGATSNSCTFFGVGRGEGTLTVDLATEVPADPRIAQVVASLSGLEFRRSDSGTETLTFRNPESVDLLDYRGARTPLRVFTSEQLPEASYSGVRLLFDEEDTDAAFVLDTAGAAFPMTLAPGEYTVIDFTVAAGRRNQSLTLSLDLRQSLGPTDDDEYVLRPVLRSVRTSDAGRIEGIVTAACPAGTSLSTAAVYLFEGENVQPDDRDGTGVEPYATAPVRIEQVVGPARYALRFLPEGRYTLALTCRGHEENPAESENLQFQNIRNVALGRAETLTHDIG